MLTVDSAHWEKHAFEKLSQLGAIVMLPTNGKVKSTGERLYLMQVAGAGDESEKGKFRPPGGHKNKRDQNLEVTIVRELQEEFALSKPQIEKNLKFLGYEYREPFWGNAVFELKNHGLEPGEYQASNSKNEKINLVEVRLGDPDYVGPDPAKLLTKEEKRDAEETEAETKSALTWDLFKEASDEDLHDLFKPDYTPEQMEEKAKSQHRLYHKMAPRLASMEKWPKEWVRDLDPKGWIEWYDQYYSGRRSTDDRRQIRRWLNFKARHGASFRANPTPRRAWALTNWAIDPLKLLPEDRRMAAQKAMEDYRDTVDGRYGSDELRKAAAQAGLEKPIKFAGKDFHGLTHYSCGHEGHCRCKHSPGDVIDERHVDYPCPLCHADEEEKKAFSNAIDMGTPVGKPPQGMMSGQSIDSSAPVLVPPPPAAHEVDVPRVVTDPEVGIAGQPKNTAIPNPGTADDYFINESLKNAETGAVHERVVASAKEGKCPRCGVAEDMGTSLSADGQITCGNCKEQSHYTEWGVSKVSASVEMKGEIHDRNKNKGPEPALSAPVQIPDPRKPKPPRMGANATGDQLKPASATGEQGPALDIPASSTTAYGVKTPMAENQPVRPIPTLKSVSTEPTLPQSVQQEQQSRLSPSLSGQNRPLGSAPTIAETAWPSGRMQPSLSQGIGSLPMAVTGMNTPMLEQQRQQHAMNVAKSATETGELAATPTLPAASQSVKKLMSSPGELSIAPVAAQTNQLGKTLVDNIGGYVINKTAMAVDAAGIPTTGPESIYYALQHLDLDKKQAEAESIVRRKLKSKRPDAVKMLGYIQGMRRSGIQPHELMITRVPVIPPQFRPYSFAGNAFVPGDANELYRDLINLVGVHGDIETNLGKAGSGFSRLNVYDAVKAVYGFGEPTSPKTRERGVGGFLTKVVGTGPKFSYPQSKMLAKDMDFTGNSVIGVDPDLGLDQIGIPDEMAWKLYAPYIQRRLVRGGMSPEQAVKHIADRSEFADRQLSAEMAERPVVYGRQPSWHKYNVIGGWPQRIKGNMIRINPLVTTGMNADFDGDTLNVHLPSMPESVEDAKNKLMASRQLFSMKDRTRVMPLPKQEFVLGLYNAQRRTPRQVRYYPDEKSALSAIKKGDIALSDEVTIGRRPMTITRMPMDHVDTSKEHEAAEALSELKS